MHRIGARQLLRLAAMIIVAVTATTGLVIAPAAADGGAYPYTAIDCGALRDNPSAWKPHAGGECPTSGYSYVVTSPSNVHYATWPFHLAAKSTSIFTIYRLSVWIPSDKAGALAQYDYQLCGSSSWTGIGHIDQEANSGWTYPTNDQIVLNSTQIICAVREHNIQTTTNNLYLAEDALGFI
jgi:hypothetical protein